MAKIDEKKPVRCSFCGKMQDEVKRLIAGKNSFICDECVSLCVGILDEDLILPKTKSRINVSAGPVALCCPTCRKPSEIKEFWICTSRSERAKIALAVAVYNHINAPLRVERRSGASKEQYSLNRATGSGNTLFAQTLSKVLQCRCYRGCDHVTEAGYVGDDVENISAGLLQAADFDVELAQRGIIYIDELDKRKEKRKMSQSQGCQRRRRAEALLKILEGPSLTFASRAKETPASGIH
jgi:ATP-dependent Clp protease ATP-binding subunit ClpX